MRSHSAIQPFETVLIHASQVLYANAHPSVSHMSADFIQTIGDCIRMTREVLFSTTGQPFIIAGSGTLGWDQVRCVWYVLDRDRAQTSWCTGRRESDRA